MRKVVKIVTQKEYDRWLAEQNSYYGANVKGKKGVDPLLMEASSEAHDDHGDEANHDENHDGEGHEGDAHEEGADAHKDEAHKEGDH